MTQFDPTIGAGPDDTLDDDTFDVGPGGDPRHPADAPHPDGAVMGDLDGAIDGLQTSAISDDGTATVAAVGRLGEAVDRVERARGSLYDFHQLTGHADALFAKAADELEAAGHPTWAAEIRLELVGRNVLDGRWSYQVVDEYDQTYWTPVRGVRDRVEQALCDGERHAFERRTKEQRRTHGRRHHEAEPPPRGSNRDRSDNDDAPLAGR